MPFDRDGVPVKDQELVSKVVRIGQLLDLYGQLLTEKQRRFVKLHYEDDLSFGEIAREAKVSRQAIHDAVKHADQSLEEYEAKLGLLARGFGRSKRLPPAEPGATMGNGTLSEARETLENLKFKVQRVGIIYNADWIVNEINEALEKMPGSGEK